MKKLESQSAQKNIDNVEQLNQQISTKQRNAKFLDLTADILTMIISYLEIRDIINCSIACKQLYHITNSNKLWHNLYKRQWSLTSSVEGKVKPNYYLFTFL